MNLYCAKSFEVNKDVALRYKIDEKNSIRFYCDKCGSRKEQGDLLRDVEYLINKDGEIKLYELSKEDEQSKEELGVNEKNQINLVLLKDLLEL